MLIPLFRDLLNSIFPDLCICCTHTPKMNSGDFCAQCAYSMPYTNHFTHAENDLTDHFKGRFRLYYGAALLNYRHDSIVKNMLHGLKYKGKKEIGEVLGAIMGRKLLKSPHFELPELVIPVPIHPRKKLRRGYNQSSIFGKSVAEVLDIRFREDILIKLDETESQTGKNRTDRVQNVSKTFGINTEIKIGGHYLIADDVVTTGATLEACCNMLLTAGASKVSIASIAVTR